MFIRVSGQHQTTRHKRIEKKERIKANSIQLIRQIDSVRSSTQKPSPLYASLPESFIIVLPNASKVIEQTEKPA